MATFQLTDGQDEITGTAGDDTIEGGPGTLSTFDTIDGGAGFDTLNTAVDQNGVQAPTISNVEEILLDTGGQPFDVSNISGAESIGTNGPSITLENIDENDLNTRFDAIDVQSGTVKLQFADGVLDAPDDRLRFLAEGANVTFTSDSTFDSTADGEQNETPDTERVEEIQISLRGSNPEAEFDNQVDISDFSAIETLVLKGDANSKVVVDSPELATIIASGTSGGVTITSDTSTDTTFRGGSGGDDLKTGTGNDDVKGGEGDDVLNVGGGDNTVRGNEGDDEITAEAGNDLLDGGDGADTIDAGSGEDIVLGGGGGDTLNGGGGNDKINGGDGADQIDGGGGNDRLSDGAGDDEVRGGAGRDIFVAGAGNDTLFGEGGQDSFLFTTDDFGDDTVEDYELTANTDTNDGVAFRFDGAFEVLRSQSDFEAFYDANQASGRVTADQANSTFTVEADGGTFTLNASDLDFLFS